MKLGKKLLTEALYIIHYNFVLSYHHNTELGYIVYSSFNITCFGLHNHIHVLVSFIFTFIIINGKWSVYPYFLLW
jgi:hypothetical protein